MIGYFSERHADVEVERSRARVLEVVVSHVGQSHVVAHAHVQPVEARAAANAQSTVEAAEAALLVAEARISLTLAIVFHLAAHAQREITAGIRLDGDVASHGVLVFYQERQLEVLQSVGELVALVPALAAFLGVGETRLEEEGRGVGDARAGHDAHVETRARVAAIEVGGVGMDRGNGHAEAEAEISVAELVEGRAAVIAAIVVVAMTRGNGPAVRIILSRCRQRGDKGEEQ